MKLLNVLEEVSNEITYFIDTRTEYITHLDGDVHQDELVLLDETTWQDATKLALTIVAKLSNVLMEGL
jgi:hypothetical protein